MTTALHSQSAAQQLIGAGARLDCSTAPIGWSFRVAMVASAIAILALNPLVSDLFATPGQVRAVRIIAVLLASIDVAIALLATGRAVSVEAGTLIVTRLAAPLRPSAERRIPSHQVSDVWIRRHRTDEGPDRFAQYRYQVNATIRGRRLPLRIALVNSETEADIIATRVRSALGLGDTTV